MKKKTWPLLLLTIIALCLIASIPLWHGKSRPHPKAQVSRITRRNRRSPHHEAVTWGYPFKKLYEKKVHFESGQEFGHTDFLRRVKPKSYFHDGWDFGFSEVGHQPVLAVHSGVVHRVHFRNGMDLYIWVISKDGYVEIYQEGFLSDTDIYVKKGQHIKCGQKIGRLTGSHLHLGITRINKHYIDKHGDPCANWWKDNGTWLNPMQTINEHMKAEHQTTEQ